MLKTYPKFKRGEAEKIFKKLSKEQKAELETLLLYREGRGLKGAKLKDLRRVLLQGYAIIQGTFKQKISTEEEAIKFSLIVSNSHFTKETKINYLIDFANTLKRVHTDWTIRFRELEMFSTKQFNKGDNSEPKNYDTITDEEIKKIYRTEKRTYWKCFFKIAEQTGGRTKEIRTSKNKKIEFNKDGTITIEIYMTKNGKKKFVFCDSETAELIKKLQEEQKNTEHYGEYLFNSPIDKDKPISKNQVCYWFRNLTQKAINRKCHPYELRHRRATILYRLAKENRISKDTATELLGHSKDMSERYTHISEADRKKILKEQAFNLELPEEKKHELEKRLENIEKLVKSLAFKEDLFGKYNPEKMSVEEILERQQRVFNEGFKKK